MGKQAVGRGGRREVSVPANSPLGRGLAAAARLLEDDFGKWQFQAVLGGHETHIAIQDAPSERKTRGFHTALVRCRRPLVALIADGYRRYVRLTLAHQPLLGGEPSEIAWAWLQPAVSAGIAELVQWTVLACDGESAHLRPIGTLTAKSGETASLAIPKALPPAPPLANWRAPGWLFLQFPAMTGIRPLKNINLPDRNAERLDAAHTRLILAGMRRIFLAELRGAVQRVRDEELAISGAAPPANVPKTKRPQHRAGWERKEKLLAVIQEVLRQNPGLEGIDFCAELDRRHAPPLPAWEASGDWDGLTFKAAWKRPALRKKIRRVRQEALQEKHHAARGGY